MPVFVLDSSALIRYIDDEPGASRMVEILKQCANGLAQIRVSAVQWGEVAGNVRKRAGELEERRILIRLPSEIEVIAATADRAVRAAELRVDWKISYADAFALELALGLPQSVLVTADYEFKPVENLINVEFLPTK